MRTFACMEGLFLVRDLIFPTVIYMGHAFLSPEKLVKWVSSEERMIGIIVDPSGRSPEKTNFVSKEIT